MVLGIGLFSAITATITSVRLEGREHPGAEIPERLRVLDELQRAGVITAAEPASSTGDSTYLVQPTAHSVSDTEAS